jgi:hypothetical protein
MAARSHTAVRIVHHRFGQRFQNSPLRSGNNPNLAGGGADKQLRAMNRCPVIGEGLKLATYLESVIIHFVDSDAHFHTSKIKHIVFAIIQRNGRH